VKVNISYAVELEDVPHEVGKLIDSCGHLLRVMHEDLDTLGTSNPVEAIKRIASIRASLSALDVRLGDCSNILGGFLQLQSNLATDTDPSPPEGSSNAE